MRVERKIVILFVLGGAAVWFADAVLDHLFFYDGSLSGLLWANVPAHEVYVRTIAFVLFVGFGLLMGRSVSRERRALLKADTREAWLAVSMRSVGDGVITVDLEGRVKWMNPVAGELTGWGEKGVGRDVEEVFRIVNAYTREPAENPVRQVLAEGVVVNLANDTVLIARDGAEHQIADSAAPIILADGKVVGVVLIFRDVTEAYERRKQLADSEKRYRELFESLSEGLAVHEIITDEAGRPVDYRYLDVNPAFERTLGLSRDAIVGRTVREIFPRIDPVWIDRYGRVALEGKAERFEAHFPQLERHFEILAYQAAPGRFATLSLDITDRRRAEIRVEQLNRVLRAIRDVNQLITRETNRQDLLEGVCRTLVETDGYHSAWLAMLDADRNLVTAASAGLGDEFLPMRHKLDDCYWPECWQRVSRTGSMVIIENTHEACGDCPLAAHYRGRAGMCAPMMHAGEDYGMLVVSTEPEIAADPEQISLFEEVAADIGLALHKIEAERYRRQAEADVHRQRNLLQRYMDTTGAIMVVLDERGRVQRVNRAGCEVLGLPESEIVGRDWLESFVPRADRSATSEALASLLAGRQGYEEGESDVLCADGRHHTIAWRNAALHDEHGQVIGVLASGMDVTEHRHVQDQLRQAQKMEAVGRLAGGIAHDFNNQLTVVQGYCDLLCRQLPEGDPSRQCIDEIHAAAQRAAHLTYQLLAYSRKQVLQPRVICVNTILEEMCNPLSRMIGEDIHFRIEASPDAGCVEVDPSQFQQAIMNLVVNARDAMPEGGELCIETHRVRVDGTGPAEPAVDDGAYVVLSVRDTGMGIAEDSLDRIFEPFYTTKPTGQGTGLGLAMVYGFTRQSGGGVQVSSELGEGTTVRLYLPQVAEAAGAKESVEIAAALPSGGGTVIVAEDETPVRQFVSRVLEHCGYRVLEAANGLDALDLYERVQEPVHLLVTDVVMPGMNGPELARRLRALHPELKVLFISGYTETAAVSQGILETGGQLLTKPFGPEAIARAVREVLAPQTP